MLQKIWKIVGVCLLKWINTVELVGAVEMITVEVIAVETIAVEDHCCLGDRC